VRRAQKAYRSRKEKHVVELEEKCRDLEGVVEDMTNTFVAFSDSLLKRGDTNPETARELKEAMKKFLALSEKAARDPWEERGMSPENTDQQPVPDLAVENTETIPQTIITDSHSQELSSASSFETTTALFNPQGTLKSPLPYGPNVTDFDNLNIYANYSIWGLPPQPQPPEGTSVIPYILAGRDSFASRLFFETVVRALRSLRGEGPAGDAYKMFRFKFRHMSATDIRIVLDGVLDSLLHGTTQTRRDDREEMAEEVDELVIKAKIVGEIETMGGSESDYLTTWDVERYLRNKWRLSLDSNWVKIQPLALLAVQDSSDIREIYDKYELFAPTVVPGFEQRKRVVWDVRSLVERLEALAVTIGQGPRWHHRDVDAAVEAFLEENRGC